MDGASFEVDDTESEVRELPLFAEAPAESSPVSKSTDMVDVEETDVAEVEEDVDVDGAIETEDGVRYESTLIFLMMQTVGSGFPSGSVQCFLKWKEKLLHCSVEGFTVSVKPQHSYVPSLVGPSLHG